MNPRLPKDKEEMNAGQPEVPERPDVVPKKSMVYTPSGMREAFKVLSKKLDIKNRKSKIQTFSEAVNVLNDGRKQRLQPETEVPIIEQPAMQKADRHLLEIEIKYVERVIVLLNDLKAYQPQSDSKDYIDFVKKYNKLAGGINKHLQEMKKAAAKLEGVDDLQQKMIALKQPAIVYSEGLIVEVKSAVVDDLQVFHQQVLALGKSADDLDIDKRTAAVSELNDLLGGPSVDINAQDQISGNTLLHLAAERGLVGLTEILMNQDGINPNILNAEDKKAILIATENANAERSGNGDKMEFSSNYTKIRKLLNPVERKKAYELQQENQKSNELLEKAESWRALAYKQANNVASLGGNFGLIKPKDAFRLAVNKNYVEHNAKANARLNSSEIGKTELTKILNPFTALSTAFSFLNTGTRALIDNLYNKLTGTAPSGKSAILPTIIKVIVAAPFTIAEAVFSGVSDAINIVVNAAVDAVKDRRSAALEKKPAKPEEKAMKITSSTQLANSRLSAETAVSHKKSSGGPRQETLEQINPNTVPVMKVAGSVTMEPQENEEVKNTGRPRGP